MIMENLMFDSFRQWRICMGAVIGRFLWGLSRMLLYVVTGIASVARWLWRKLVMLVSGYPEMSIVAAFAVCAFVWVLTFASGRARLASAECQRDSFSYRLHQLTREDDGELVVIGDDTLKIFSYDRP